MHELVCIFWIDGFFFTLNMNGETNTNRLFGLKVIVNSRKIRRFVKVSQGEKNIPFCLFVLLV